MLHSNQYSTISNQNEPSEIYGDPYLTSDHTLEVGSQPTNIQIPEEYEEHNRLPKYPNPVRVRKQV
jgi:hypothetical protein